MFIAALDQSGGSTPNALKNYGVECTEDNMMDLMHQMRTRVVQSEAFLASKIDGVILFRDSLERGLGSWLHDKGFKVFAKVDVGMNPDGSLKDFNLDWLDNYPFLFGTKMRSVVHYTDTNYIRMIIMQQLMYAYRIKQKGLTPIVEPEVPITHSKRNLIEIEIESTLEKCDLTGIICKLTIPATTMRYQNLNCSNLVALSGGFSTDEACDQLRHRKHMGASFSRALLERLHFDQTDEEFNNTLSANISHIRSACSVSRTTPVMRNG